MKKIILLILVLICCSCNKDSKKIELPREEIKYDDTYIEIIPDNAKKFIDKLNDGNEIILTKEEIKSYNNEIKNKTNTIYDLDAIVSLTKEEILNYINFYQIPSLPQYSGENEITNSDINQILENRNIDNVEDKNFIPKGIIVTRSNLKSFPTDMNFFSYRNSTNFDNLQESELHINTPVLVLHESKDQEWIFVLTYAYSGWMKQANIAYVNEEDYNFFIKNNNFVIITEPIIEIDGVILDMSVKLPYDKAVENGYQVYLPTKDQNGNISKKIVILSKDKAHIGYLPYNKRNVYIQAFKYEGVNYSWGGMDMGVDCSSYVSNVYRTFGFMFPRNTSSQNSSVGEVISLTNKTLEEKQNIISNHYPSLLYQIGHTMLYLGEIDGKHYIIHASGDSMKVEVTELSRYLNTINKLVLIQ